MPAPNERNDAGAKVTVACKIPHGVVLRGMVERTERESVLGGGTREYKAFRWDGETEQAIAGPGPSHPVGGFMPRAEIVAGYAITRGVSKDLWDNWYGHNKDNPYCKQKMIFAYESADRVRGEAKDHEKLTTGFEMLDRDDPGKKVKGISKADRN